MVPMKRLRIFCLLLLVSGAGWATTLGEATSELIEKSGTLIVALEKEPSTWGIETALKDLQRLNQSARALERALDGQDAEQLKRQQTELSTASRRVETSAALIPESARGTVQHLSERVAAINERLTDLRLRFGTRASMAPGALSQVSLEASAESTIYDNPSQLLIDVRDIRSLAQQLQVAPFPPLGVGLNSPNNLDSLQVRRLVLATWELERQLSSQYQDIRESLPTWNKVKREYNRLGYVPPSVTIRQLERVMRRMDAFYSEFE